MSPHAVNNFVQDLVEMAKAMEELPQAKAETQRLTHELNSAEQRCQDRELAIIDYKHTIDDLLAKVRDLEVARDDAELRFLEADDRATNVLAMVRAATVSLGQVNTLLDPSKPEPVEPPQVAQVVQPPTSWASPFSHNEPPVPEVAAQPDPTSASDTNATHSSESPPIGTDGKVDGSVTDGPYTSRRYIDVPGWISRDDWLAGGGTQEDYDYRSGF